MQQPDIAYAVVMHSPLGRLGIRLDNGCVCALDYLPATVPLKRGSGLLARQVEHELQAWFRNPRTRFSVPLATAGTPFQDRVRTALCRIPAGQVQTYGQLAARLDSGARAVGNACRHNPLPILVPCHRVIGARGIGGYAGSTGGEELARKQWLLRHEGYLDPALKFRPAPPSSDLFPRRQRIAHA